MSARRVDAGRPWVTRRDVAVLRWLGEQYGARVDVLGVLLARWSPGGPSMVGGAGGRWLPGEQPAVSRQTTLGVVGRWARAGLTRRVRLLGWTWVVPTRGGLEQSLRARPCS